MKLHELKIGQSGTITAVGGAGALRCCLLDTPMLMGLWRPCILLPEVELEEQQLRYVLLHELSHRRRRDLWLKFLLLVAKAVHWFNPLVWWMARRASADIEVACDADVLRLHDTKEERREYGALILYFIQLSRGRAIPLTTNFSEKGQIMRRFQEMMNTSKKRVGLLLFALICAAAVGSTAFVNLHVRAEEEPDLQLSEPMQQEMDILAAERAQTQQALDGREEDEAARRAGLSEFIRTLPDGYETQMGQMGARLSGGERQRVGIARVMLMNPDVIVMDEPTSSLDVLHEKELLQTLRGECGDKMLLIVSHRHSTLTGCNRIIRLENGRAFETEGSAGGEM